MDLIKFNIIVACDNENGIGLNNKIPWRDKDDMYYFKNITSGGNNSVIMGRKTWDSLPKKPLPKRKNIIITSSNIENIYENTIFVNNFESLFKELIKNNFETNWIIGGSSIYKYMLDNYIKNIEYIHFTRICNCFNCDTFFPNLKEEFILEERIVLNHISSVYIYKNSTYHNMDYP